jgi:hypothetical protein
MMTAASEDSLHYQQHYHSTASEMDGYIESVESALRKAANLTLIQMIQIIEPWKAFQVT